MAFSPAWITAGATALDVLGGFFGRKKKSTGLDHRSFAIQKDLAYNGIQRRVEDAKNAGIHPLYAIGAPASSMGTFAGTSSSGSILGEGISRVGRATADAIRQGRQDKRRAKLETRAAEVDAAQIRALDAKARNDDAHAALALSQMKRAEQRANETRTVTDGAQTFPMGTKPVPVAKRPIKNYPRESHVPTVSVPGDFYKYAPPELGGDEINQVIWAVNRLVEKGYPLSRKLGTKWGKLDARLNKARRSILKKLKELF